MYSSSRFTARSRPEPLTDAPAPPASTVPEPPEIPDPIGHRAWAGEFGISPQATLLVAATALAHAAGPSVYWDDRPGLGGVRIPSLMTGSTDVLLGAGISRLVAELRSLRNRLVKGTQEFNEADANAAFQEVPFAGNSVSTAIENLKNLERTTSNSTPDEILSSTLRDRGNRLDELENMLSSNFLADSLPSGPLDSFLAGFHQGSCFLAGGPVCLPVDKSQRHRRIDDLSRFLNGGLISGGPTSSVRSKLASIGGIFTLSQQDLEWLFQHRMDFLRQLIPVSSNPSGPDEAFDYNPELSARFDSRFAKAAFKAVAFRRTGHRIEPTFGQQLVRKDFILRRRQHLLLCANDPVHLTALPDLIMWFLLLMGSDADEQELVEIAMDTTAVLRSEARRNFFVQEENELGSKRLENASKMLRRLAERGPSKRHELVRVFNKQGLRHHAPVIDALIAHGFMVEDSQHFLSLGTQPAARLDVGHLINV